MVSSDLFFGALFAFIATSLGAAAVLPFKKIGNAFYSILISFCAGVMVYSAIEMLNESHALSGHSLAFIGFVCGLLIFFILEKLLPHAHSLIRKKELSQASKKATLLAGTITMHNIPEGFAIASAFALSSPLGWLVTASIAFQDIPEGLMISAPLACYGITTKRSFLWGVFSGFVEFVAAIFGYFFLNAVTMATPFALAFSAGAMGYVALFELFLDSLQEKDKHSVILSFIAGIGMAFVLAALLHSN